MGCLSWSNRVIDLIAGSVIKLGDRAAHRDHAVPPNLNELGDFHA